MIQILPYTIFVVRIALVFLLFRFSPLIAVPINFFADALDDLIYKYLLKRSTKESTYQMLDKLADFVYYCGLFVYVIIWIQTPLWPLLVALFLYRSIGQLLFFATNRREILPFFPNFFEEYAYVVIAIKVIGLSYIDNLSIIVFSLMLLTIYKIIMEYSIHYAKLSFVEDVIKVTFKGFIAKEKKRAKIPKVSIVIPTYNEEKHLPKLLKSIKNQTLKPYEIIVADRKGKDKTRQIARKAGCKVVDGGIVAVGRNAGLKKSKGEVVIFVDADVEFREKDFLEVFINKFVTGGWDIATAFYKPSLDSGLKGSLVIWAANVKKSWSMILYALFGQVISMSGGFLVVKKKVAKDVGGFDEKMEHFEDYDFGKRVLDKGYDLGYVFRRVSVSGRRYDKKSPAELLKMWVLIVKFRVSNFFGLKGSSKMKKQFEKSKGNLGGGN